MLREAIFICVISVVIDRFSVVNGFSVIGNSCTTADNASGICKPIKDCVVAIRDIRINKKYPNVCGYDGFVQIICCADVTQIPIKQTQSTIHNPATVRPNLRVSEQKCKEYSNYTYSYSTAINLATGETIVKPTLNCPFARIPLIVGGTAAASKEYPHMALIGYDSVGNIHWGCAGSLISEEYVLTAAHCLASAQFGSPKYVKLGDLILNNNSDDAKPIDVTISERIKHPNYTARSNYNDIGLIKLSRKISFDSYIRPACLASTFDTNTEKAIATGWGQTEWLGDSSDKLLRVILEIFPHQECNSKFDTSTRLKNGIDDQTQICFGSHAEEKDTCQGDSGGPLQIYHPMEGCMYTIVGVTSFGAVCGVRGIPGVYTRVYSYLSWIEQIVWSEE